MVIKILGKVSLKSDYLFTVIQTAICELQFDIEVIRIEDDQVIHSFNTKQTPALIIDDKLIFEGFVPGITEIKKIIKKLNLNKP